MSVVAGDLVAYGSANRPTDDGSTSGGAIDTAARPTMSLLSADDTIEVLSDGADTRDVTLTGRNAAGNIVTEVLTLSGTTPVGGSQTFERLHSAVLSASDGSRTVTVREATSDTVLASIGPNETESFIHFQRASSESAQVTRYEKAFWKNENGSSALQNADVTLTADPEANIRIALEGSKDGTDSVANRETDPGHTFQDDSTAISVPTGDLGAGEAIGVWIEQTLAADNAPVLNTFTHQLAGDTA